MTAYKGIRSFRAEQTSGIIKLLVREYVLVCAHFAHLCPLQWDHLLLWSVFPSKSSHAMTDQRYPRTL